MAVKAGIKTSVSVINLTIPQNATFEEIFTYTDDTVIKVESVAGFTIPDQSKLYVDLDGEEVWVKSIGTDSIVVERGQDGTTITSHLRGSSVKSITSADTPLIEDGDDFGFSGTWT